MTLVAAKGKRQKAKGKRQKANGKRQTFDTSQLKQLRRRADPLASIATSAGEYHGRY
jgi:hypothetical protein